MSASVTQLSEQAPPYTVFDGTVADATVPRPGSELADHVDRDYDAETSIVLRYRHAFNFGDRDRPAVQGPARRNEHPRGVRIVPLFTYKGVDIWVKHAAHQFAQMHGLAHIPQVAWRYEASRFRGMLIVEHCLSEGRFTSGVSAANGRARAEFTIPSLRSTLHDYTHQLEQAGARA